MKKSKRLEEFVAFYDSMQSGGNVKIEKIVVLTEEALAIFKDDVDDISSRLSSGYGLAFSNDAIKDKPKEDFFSVSVFGYTFHFTTDKKYLEPLF